MRWSRVCLEAIGYELPKERVTSAALEARLEPLYRALNLGPGQLEALTGIRERRFWPRGTRMADVAALAGRKALEASGVAAQDLGVLIFAGVCRDQLEPATACEVAHSLGVAPETIVFDVSNACLGVMNGMVDIANRIELGQVRAGLVVSAESARHIVDGAIDRMLAEPTLERLRLSLATLTGGSGAVGVVLTDESLSDGGHRLHGAAALADPEHHRLCRWGPAQGLLGESASQMDTDASGVLSHGVALGERTWAQLMSTLEWRTPDVDKVICHQVGGPHRDAVLKALGVSPDRDFSIYRDLGNIGTVSLPLAAAFAHEAKLLSRGERVAFLGIGSGLNCLMAGLTW
jgi:3-oxoacyl-[acyl-carrier-protein] synthase-3